MIKYLTILLFSTSIAAMPQKVEVWFLSVDKTTWLHKTINNKTANNFLTAQNNYQCQPMGDYCFDPQIGLYKKGSAPDISEGVENSKFETTQDYDFIEPASSVDREMIDCDESNFFDVFCGRAQKKIKSGKTPLEVWVDVSSTMKQVDFKGLNDKCAREQFLEDLSQTCPLNKKMKVYYFTEFKFEAGAFDRVCLSNGLNNIKKLKEDISNSKAKHLIVITDIFEAQDSFINWVENLKNGSIKGIDKPLYASKINQQLQRVRKLCR